MRKPNLFIVGAPKCGTTSLYEYLKGHPQIFMSLRKEPSFWATDLTYLRKFPNLDAYLQLFEDADGSHRYLGEASAVYLRSETAIPAIRDFTPDARLIVMLRNPVDMLPSLHSERRFRFGENEPDFETAWRKEEQGYLHPRYHGSGPSRYRDMANYPLQIERVFHYFPREQVHIILFHDFIRNTGEVYKELIDWLEIDDDGRRVFDRFNENKIWKNERLGKFLITPPPVLRKLTTLYKRVTGAKEVPFRKTAYDLNMTNIERKPISPAFRRELTDYFREDTDKLSILIGRDLSHWKEVQPPESD